ncbi:WD40 repeat-like protein [Multifurca ochricompacta]|uniref:WD40 repeat-like protein n=1 Tax=Multifurca ochricompacta TaxID=376703 RepID=A0AAD4MGI0_9AGAM|nr:WD40 repeat-like protein [Multifurca ochricompacta]
MIPSISNDIRTSQKPSKTRRHRRSKPKDRENLPEGPTQASASVSAEQLKSWPWFPITESSTTKHPVVFTKDGSYFFSIVGSSVKIHSTASGLVVSTLSTKRDIRSHTDTITSAVLNPHNAYQLITGSLDGHIKVWDFLDGILLQTIGVGHPIRHIAAHEQWKDFLFVAVARPSKKKKGNRGDDNGVVLRVSLRPSPVTLGLPVQTPSESLLVGKTRTTHGLAVSAGGSWLVAVGGHKAYIAPTSNLKVGFTKFVSPEALTCLTFHPTEEYFATGDEKGNIRLWYCLNENIAVPKADVEKRAPTTTLHWHAHAVSALTFTPNGAYLLSGGEESVLVVWQIHSGKKEFVPRVGAPIYSVAISKTPNDEEEYLLGLADTSLVFINAGKLTTSRSYSGIKLGKYPAISHNRPSMSVPTPLTVHSLSSTLILPSSHPSSLQTYSPSSSKVISELEVSPSNRISRRDEKTLEPLRVERAVVSPSGEWLATIDSREGDECFRGEIYLKVWRWETSSELWILNTRIDRPHGLAKVTSVVFSPNDVSGSGICLVTSGEDGNVKSWRIRSVIDKKTGTTDVFWVVRSSLTFKRETPWSVSWSPDGSLLAVAFGTFVAIYDPISNALIRAFTALELRGRVYSVHFLGNEGRFLVVAGCSDVVLWDLVEQKVQWHHRSVHPISAIVTHPQDRRFVIFHSQPPRSTVLIFGHSTNNPHNTYTLPFMLRNIVWYPRLPSKARETSTFHLVGITDKWDVVFIGDGVHPLAGEGSVTRGLRAGSQESHKRTLFQDIFGDSALSGAPVLQKQAADARTSRFWNGKEITNILDGPAYLIPPLETFFDPLLSHFLTPRPLKDETGNVPGAPGSEKKVSMDVDEPHDLLVSAARTKRLVDDPEMEALIELFRRHGVKGRQRLTQLRANGLTYWNSALSPAPRGQTSNVQTSNGHQTMNGHPRTPKPKISISTQPSTVISIDSSPEGSARTVVASSPAKTGRKRKISAAL